VIRLMTSFLMFVACFQLKAQESTDVTIDVSSEETADSAANATKMENCDEIKLSNLSITPATVDGNLQIQLAKDHNVIDKLDPYIDGPDSKCLKQKYFEKEMILIAEVCRGFTGTKVLVERHALLIIKVADNKLKLVETVDLKHNEHETTGVTTTIDKMYRVSERSGKIVTTVTDKKTKEQKEILF
jgi:hypothetical protein